MCYKCGWNNILKLYNKSILILRPKQSTSFIHCFSYAFLSLSKAQNNLMDTDKYSVLCVYATSVKLILVLYTLVQYGNNFHESQIDLSCTTVCTRQNM
jgi:hypothetical protein